MRDPKQQFSRVPTSHTTRFTTDFIMLQYQITDKLLPSPNSFIIDYYEATMTHIIAHNIFIKHFYQTTMHGP